MSALAKRFASVLDNEIEKNNSFHKSMFSFPTYLDMIERAEIDLSHNKSLFYPLYRKAYQKAYRKFYTSKKSLTGRRVNVQLSFLENKKIQKAMREAKTHKLSSFLRDTTLSAISKSSEDPYLNERYRSLQYELKKIGNNINQAALHANRKQTISKKEWSGIKDQLDSIEAMLLHAFSDPNHLTKQLLKEIKKGYVSLPIIAELASIYLKENPGKEESLYKLINSNLR